MPETPPQTAKALTKAPQFAPWVLQSRATPGATRRTAALEGTADHLAAQNFLQGLAPWSTHEPAPPGAPRPDPRPLEHPRRPAPLGTPQTRPLGAPRRPAPLEYPAHGTRPTGHPADPRPPRSTPQTRAPWSTPLGQRPLEHPVVHQGYRLPLEDALLRPAPEDEHTLECFDHLLVPRFSRYRFAELPQSPHSSSAPPPNTATEDSLEALKNAVAAEWRLAVPTEKEVLVYGHLSTGARKWRNVLEVVDELEQTWKSRIRINYIPDLAKLTPREQAQAFYAASGVLTAFGGHLANLVFARRGTPLLEIACQRPKCVCGEAGRTIFAGYCA
ncbi:hypothetical protein CYMTET_13810 [Cymbomonas tetramitiformis]|uniref:Glycosyltransferase 61 catalytic domain-containing protein n=1 Tax=Cymbomonas tetramitiformis TaxID=36881 RepID=A0AAE0LAN3_9CHLO|nr:hypothetical protein CYMTET_13810 [Cymbomonas tetramitiformis]